jgi:hypothetical protein
MPQYLIFDYFCDDWRLMLVFRDLLSAFGLGQKKINQILTKENGDETRLEELLGEEETITECRQNN